MNMNFPNMVCHISITKDWSGKRVRMNMLACVEGDPAKLGLDSDRADRNLSPSGQMDDGADDR
jgi:hypothetical protein